MGRLQGRRPFVRVARETNGRLRGLDDDGVLDRMRLMAIGTRDVRRLMLTSGPVRRRAALMTAGACFVPFLDGRCVRTRKHDCRQRTLLTAAQARDVIAAVAVAILAALIGNTGPRVSFHHVRRMKNGRHRGLIVAIHTTARIRRIAQGPLFLSDRRRRKRQSQDEDQQPEAHISSLPQ